MPRKARAMFRKRRPPPGSAPGEFVVPESAQPPRIHVIDYTPGRVTESDVTDAESLRGFRDADSVTWIDVQGLGNEPLLRAIGELFEIHPLAMADVFNVPQRPKVEEYEHHALVISQIAEPAPPGTVQLEQLSLVLGKTYVITFQERYGDPFDPIRARIRQGQLVRRMGPDYLAYSLIDAVIDGYYPLLESFGDFLQQLEDEVVTRPRTNALHRIQIVRRQLLHLRRGVWPQREAVNGLLRESPFICDAVRVYLRDCYDHVVQIMDVLETYRETAGGLMEVHLSSIANRTNEVMKVLTVISSVFIPLTFIVGVYGMNFEFMPELHVPVAYPIVWVVLITVAIGMLAYFWRLGWIGGRDDEQDRE
jgi:magnesium transporter